MKKHLISTLLAVIACLLVPLSVNAVPNLISYQGILNDKDGVPVGSSVDMTFRIYNVESGGTAIWSETQNVTVSNGTFNVKLGSVESLPFNMFLNDAVYLGIQVGADPEMMPRQQFTSGAFTYKTETVAHVGVSNRNDFGVGRN